MYRDRTLIPTEAIRLLALGVLADGPRRYDELAVEVRRFASRIVGPSSDVFGPSLELLRYEGLVAALDEAAFPQTRVGITDAGRAELRRLLIADVRAPIDGFSELVIALKFRFLDALPVEERGAQLDALVAVCEREIARLEDLRGQHGSDDRHLMAWLDRRIEEARSRIGWLLGYRNRI